MSIEHLPSRDALLDILGSDQASPLAMALQWAHDTEQPELDELWTALFDHVRQRPDSELGRAALIVMDAHMESRGRKAA